MNLHSIMRYDPDRLTYNVEVPLFAPVYRPARQAYFLARSRAPGKHGPGFCEELETPYHSIGEAIAAAQRVNNDLKQVLQKMISRQLDRYTDKTEPGL